MSEICSCICNSLRYALGLGDTGKLPAIPKLSPPSRINVTDQYNCSLDHIRKVEELSEQQKTYNELLQELCKILMDEGGEKLKSDLSRPLTPKDKHAVLEHLISIQNIIRKYDKNKSEGDTERVTEKRMKKYNLEREVLVTGELFRITKKNMDMLNKTEDEEKKRILQLMVQSVSMCTIYFLAFYLK